MDIGEAMALTNSNNNWMNNPFMYLIWLAFFGGDGFGVPWKALKTAFVMVFTL